jgi:hypothetical protein
MPSSRPVPRTRVLQQGEGVSSVGYQEGFFPGTLWEHPSNAALRARRSNPNALMPGDVLTVPDLRPKQLSVPTGAKHTFRRKGVPAVFALQVFDGDTPRARQRYELDVDGKVLRGSTDGDGKLFEYVAPDAKRGRLTIGEDEERFVILFGHLDPLEELTGVQKRLENLGFDCGAVGGKNEGTRAALRAFQRRLRLPETGEPDEATLDKLRHMHDDVSSFPERR